MPTPYIGFSGSTLQSLPQIKIGDILYCPFCLDEHTIKGAKNEQGRETDLFMFVSCGETARLVGVGGKMIVLASSDVSGRF